MEIDEPMVRRLCEPYGISVLSFSTLSGGLINTNVLVESTQGPILLRIYVAERTPTQVEFEMSVLERLGEAALAVQRPRATLNGELVSIHLDHCYAILDYVPGRPMDEDHLDDAMAADIGRFVGSMNKALTGFQPRGTRPSADTEFISAELRSMVGLEDGYSAIQDLWPTIRDHFTRQRLPQGVVHADIYPGNVIVDEANNLQAVIDFDDCYWGTVLFDLAIVTMSFSFSGALGHDWRRANIILDSYQGVQGKVEPMDLYLAMVLNCVRFYVYTLPLTRSAGDSASDNAFAQRALYLMQPEVMSEFMDFRSK